MLCTSQFPSAKNEYPVVLLSSVESEVSAVELLSSFSSIHSSKSEGFESSKSLSLRLPWSRPPLPLLHAFGTMIGENRQLVTSEPVEFEKEPGEVQDCRKITDHFRGIYRLYPNLVKENRRMSTCNGRLDLQTLGSRPVMPKISPITASEWMILYASPLLDAVLLQSVVVLSNVTSSLPVLSVVHFEHCDGVLRALLWQA